MSTPDATPTRLAVVTVSYRSATVLRAFLASIDRPDALVVVADSLPDGDDEVRGIVADAGARYLATPDNPGYGGAVNRAVADLPDTVDWVLVSNPDVVLAPGALERLVAVGDADAGIGAVGPLIREATGAVYPSARSVPSLRTGIGHAAFANLWPGNPWTAAYRHDGPDRQVTRDAGWLSGSCVLVRRSAFDAVGGFDSGYFMYFEDVDLGYRITRSGLRNVYEPSAEATHLGAHSTSGESDRMLRAHHDSARRFLEKKYSAPVLWPLRIAARVGLDLRYRVVRRRNARAAAGEARSG